MGLQSRRRRKEVYHTVGWITREAGSDMFIGWSLPGGDVVRVMDNGLHIAALESAGRKLKELHYKSGKREPSL